MTSLNTYASSAAIHQQSAVGVVRPFPFEGKVRVKQAAPYLGVAVSTFWLYVKQGRIKPPMRYGARVSVWDAQYIRELAEHGIPEREGAA